MPIVPSYKAKLGVQAGAPNPNLQPMDANASGVAPQQANEKLAASIEDASSKIADRIIQQRRLDEQQQINDAVTDSQKTIDEHLYSDGKGDVPLGFLNRQGDQAKGITRTIIKPGETPTGDEDDFDSVTAKVRKGLAAKGFNARQLQDAERLFDAHVQVKRNAVLRHEVEQTRLGEDRSVEAQVESLKNTASLAKDQDELYKVTRKAQDIRVSHARERGASGEDILSAIETETADKFLEANVKSNIERNPALAQSLLKSAVGISEPVRSTLQTAVDGKMLDLRRVAVWDQVQGLKNADGSSDYGAMQTEAERLTEKLTPGDREHVMGYIRQQAQISDAVTADHRQSQTRQFFNDAIKYRDAGMNYEKASELLFKQKGYGYDIADHEEKRKQLVALYTKDESFYEDALQHQTQAQKLAWADIENIAAAKFTNKQTVRLEGEDFDRPAKALWLNEMKKHVLGMPPEQMRKFAAESLKEIVVEPGYLWDTKRPAWQVGAESDAAASLKMAGLQDMYGSELVNQARSKFSAKGVIPTPKDVRDMIEKKNGR